MKLSFSLSVYPWNKLWCHHALFTRICHARNFQSHKFMRAEQKNAIDRSWIMMTSSNGNIFRVTGPLCGEFTGHPWNPLTEAVTRSFGIFFDLCLNKRLTTHWRRHRAHYDVTVMMMPSLCLLSWFQCDFSRTMGCSIRAAVFHFVG